MSPPSTKQYAFAEKDYDWSRYARVRPKYPAALGAQILAYHFAHGGKLEAAHDVGTGWGIVAQKYLVPHFERVYVSDPAGHNLNAARHLLRAEMESGKVVSREAGAEECWLPAQSVDLVTAFECLHWSDTGVSVPAIAAQLRPGGTFAAFYYTPQPFVLEEERVQRAWHEVFERFSVRQYEDDSMTVKYLGGCFHGLDGHVALPESEWECGAVRTTINADVLGTAGAFAHAQTPFQIGSQHRSEGHGKLVGKHDVCRSITDLENWTEEVDFDWLADLVRSLQPRMQVERIEDELDELKAAVEEAGGTVRVTWVCALLLATRRRHFAASQADH